MGLSRRQNLSIGLGMLVLFTLTGAATYQLTRPKSVGQPVPVLNNMRICSWLRDDVAFVQQTSEPFDFLIANLRTGTLSRLPTPPPVPDKKRRGDGYTEAYVRSEPELSPDGQWLLYEESHVWGWNDSGGPLGSRWRLLSTSEGTSRFWPAEGSFVPAPNKFMEERVQTRALRWLPDSSGWVELTQLSSGACSLWRYDLAAQAPQSLPPPSLKSGFEFKQLLPNGQAVSAHQTELALVPLLPGAPPATHHKLAPLPGGRDYSVIGLTPEGLLVHNYYMVERQGLARWIASRLRMESEFREIWRIPLQGGAPQKLAMLPLSTQNLTLTQDQKRLLYWTWIPNEETRTPDGGEPDGEARAAYLALPEEK